MRHQLQGHHRLLSNLRYRFHPQCMWWWCPGEGSTGAIRAGGRRGGMQHQAILTANPVAATPGCASALRLPLVQENHAHDHLIWCSSTQGGARDRWPQRMRQTRMLKALRLPSRAGASTKPFRPDTRGRPLPPPPATCPSRVLEALKFSNGGEDLVNRTQDLWNFYIETWSLNCATIGTPGTPARLGGLNY